MKRGLTRTQDMRNEVLAGHMTARHHLLGFRHGTEGARTGFHDLQLIAFVEAKLEKPKLGEWLQLISFICGALGLFAVGVSAFQDLKDHERRITKIEDSATRQDNQRNETNERLARIEERLNSLVSRREP